MKFHILWDVTISETFTFTLVAFYSTKVRMDGWIDRWMDRWTHGWMDEKMADVASSPNKSARVCLAASYD